MEGDGGKERGTRALSFTAGETQWGSAGGPVRPSVLLAEGAGGQESLRRPQTPNPKPVGTV